MAEHPVALDVKKVYDVKELTFQSISFADLHLLQHILIRLRVAHRVAQGPHGPFAP